MQPGAEHIAGLIAGYLKEELDEAGKASLNAWVSASGENQQLFEQLTGEDTLLQRMNDFSAVDSDRIWDKTMQRLQLRTARVKTPVIKMNRWRYMAAASIIVLLSTGAYLWFQSNKKAPAIPGIAVRFKNDVPPGGDKAILTLANGAAIELNNTSNGTVFQQGNTKVSKEASQLVYYNAAATRATTAPTVLSYNTVSTPKGGQFRVVLPDGSKVWLNASSSLCFPTVFSANERNVELAGEAYFEIAPLVAANSGSKVPFHVSVNGMKVEVMGTHFNVMAYANEESVKTTLLEGAVKVVSVPTPHSTQAIHDALLQPGQQSQLDKNGIIKVADNVVIGEAVAWKNGRFYFKNADIKVIMRQVERWYDAEVVYENDIPDHFVADIPRDVPASKLLELLELTNHVHFKIEGKKITVMP
jgi:ferric-dicitrate binding protein FerR (iron transport regulator)